MAGYHIQDIPKGKFGTLGKLKEELAELYDAENQGIKVMMLCELSDLVGAIKEYLRLNFPDMTLKDLEDMANATHRAFLEGHRQSSD